MPIYTYNSQTHDRLNEKKAEINYFKTKKTIYEIYHQALRDANNNVVNKDQATNILINNKKIDISYEESFYTILWCQYFMQNKNFYKSLRTFNTFCDVSNSRLNKVIESIVKEGIEQTLLIHKPFMDILKNLKNYNTFDNEVSSSSQSKGTVIQGEIQVHVDDEADISNSIKLGNQKQEAEIGSSGIEGSEKIKIENIEDIERFVEDNLESCNGMSKSEIKDYIENRCDKYIVEIVSIMSIYIDIRNGDATENYGKYILNEIKCKIAGE